MHWMQPVDKFMFVGGIGMLLPRVDRRLWAWQIKRKGNHANLVAPSPNLNTACAATVMASRRLSLFDMSL